MYGKCSFHFNVLINNSKCEKQSYCGWKKKFFLNLQPGPNFNIKVKHSWKVWKSNYQEMQILPLFHNSVALVFNPLSANPTKWSNTLKQFVGNLPTNYLSVFDHFVKLAVKVLIKILWKTLRLKKIVKKFKFERFWSEFKMFFQRESWTKYLRQILDFRQNRAPWEKFNI